MVFAMSVSSCAGGARVGVRGPERLVDVEQRLLLTFGEPAVGEDRQLDGPDLAVVEVEDPGVDVERLRRDPQRLRELLEHLGRRLAESSFDLAEVRVRDAR